MRLDSRRSFLAAALPLAVIAAACNYQPSTPVAQAPGVTPGPAPAAAPAQSAAERGKVLVTAGGCNDCHTTKKMGAQGPEPDMTKELSGHPESIKITAPFKPAAGSPWTIATNDTLTAWSGPWGVSFAANLTPDPTGLRMSEKNFLTALKTGAHLGTARPILPPMPWNWYSQLSDDDLKAIYAYLKTIKPIANTVPEPLPPAGAGPAK